MTRNYGLTRRRGCGDGELMRRYRRFTWGDVLATLAAVGLAGWFVVEALQTIAGS